MKTTHTLFAAAAIASTLLAQQAVQIPPIAVDTEGNQITSYPFGKTRFRSQILVDQASVANSIALISSLDFRPDNDNSGSKAQTTLPYVQIEMSQTTVSPDAMSTSFLLNRTGPTTVVYSGPLTLPAHTSSDHAIAPWISIPLDDVFLFDAANGHLLIDIVATDPSGSLSTGYSLDAHTPGGAVRHFGTAGVTANGLPESVSVSGYSGNTSLVPGGLLSAAAGGFHGPAPNGFFVVGLESIEPSLDLGVIGWTGGRLYVVPILIDPIYAMPPQGRWLANYQLPTDPSFVGAKLFTQSLIQDALAPGGIFTTRAQEITIGDSRMHSNQVRSLDPNATNGTKDKTTGGGPVIQLRGPLFD